MREVKFRGKVFDDYLWTLGKTRLWVKKGEFVYTNHDDDMELKNGNFFLMVEDGTIDPATVGQYTGLKSRGVEWYDGDIVEHVGKKYFIAWHFNRWVLRELIDGYKAPVYSGKMHEIDKTSIDAGFFKVIGSIHDKEQA